MKGKQTCSPLLVACQKMPNLSGKLKVYRWHNDINKLFCPIPRTVGFQEWGQNLYFNLALITRG